MGMTIEEARGFLIGISYKLGSMSVEYLSEKDGEKMREAISVLEQEPTTKNDIHCLYTDEEIAKSFIEDVEAVKDLLPTTKNDLGVDAISRADAIKAMQDKAKELTNEDTINGLCGAVAILFDMPSVTPQEPQTFKWCTRK